MWSDSPAARTSPVGRLYVTQTKVELASRNGLLDGVGVAIELDAGSPSG